MVVTQEYRNTDLLVPKRVNLIKIYLHIWGLFSLFFLFGAFEFGENLNFIPIAFGVGPQIQSINVPLYLRRT